MQRIILDAAVGQLSVELARRGVAADALVHAVVEVLDGSFSLPMAAIAQTGRALDWLAEEPDFYSDADLASGTE